MKRTTLTLGAILVGLHLAVGLLTLVWLPYDPTGMSGGRLALPSWDTGPAPTASAATSSPR